MSDVSADVSEDVYGECGCVVLSLHAYPSLRPCLFLCDLSTLQLTTLLPGNRQHYLQLSQLDVSVL
eukprot:scaffold222571_cov15-Tisochrysis_lutea.AAC.1